MTAIQQSIHKYYLPFGHHIAEKPKPTMIATIRSVVQRALPLSVIGGFIGGVYQRGIAGFVTGCVVQAGIAAISRLWEAVKKEPLVQKPVVGVPSLGKYQSASIRLADAVQAHEWKKELIHKAKQSIEILGSYAGGVHFQEVLDIIEYKLRQEPQLRVHILFCPDMATKKDNRRLLLLQKYFPESFRFCIAHSQLSLKPPHTREMHAKMVVVDQKYFVLGGTSIFSRLNREISTVKEEEEELTVAAKLLEKSVQDMDTVGCSEAIAWTMRDQFFRLYRIYEAKTKPEVNSRFYEVAGSKAYAPLFHEPEGLFKDVKVKFIVGGPEHKEKNPITKEYVKRIEKAQESIELANLYFWPVKAIREAVSQKKDKTVYIGNGLGPSFSLTRTFITCSARGNYGLVSEVYESQVEKQLFHMKTAVFDKKHLLIGSYNLCHKSESDYEVALLVKSAKVAACCTEVFKDIKAKSRRIDSEQISENKHMFALQSAVIEPFMRKFF